jgi:hypothetical protein
MYQVWVVHAEMGTYAACRFDDHTRACDCAEKRVWDMHQILCAWVQTQEGVVVSDIYSRRDTTTIVR